jgi:AsmA protein
MKKIIIWLLALAGGIVALLIAAVIVLPRFIDVESYLPEIEKKISEATGRPATLGRDFDVSVFPWAGVSFNDLQLGNPEGFGGGNFITVDSFEARVKLWPLLSKKIEINKFVLDGPQIQLVKATDGSNNWTFTAKEGTEASPAPEQDTREAPQGQDSAATDFSISSLEVGEFAVTNGRLTYEDKGSAQTSVIDGITFQLQDVSLETPVVLMFAARVDGRPVSVEGTVGPIGRIPGQGTVKIDLTLQALEQLVARLEGEIQDPATRRQFAMNVAVDTFSPRLLFQNLEIPFPVETADGSALDKVRLDFHIQGDSQTISMTDSSITLDDSTLLLDVVIKDMARPNVALNLNLDSINLDRYLPPPSEKVKEDSRISQDGTAAKQDSGSITAEKSVPATGMAEKQIDYEPLRKLILDGEIKVAELIAHGARVADVVVKVVGKDGIFELNPFQAALYQGKAEVVGNLNVQQEKPVGNITLQVDNIMVGPLLQDSMNKNILQGNMSASADISFNGDTGPEIKKSLNGTGDLKFLDGAIVGIDLAEMGRSLAAGVGYQKPAQKPQTDFAELRVPFGLVNGLFQMLDATLLSPLLRVNAAGTADLVSEKLDVKVRPRIVGTLQGQGDTTDRSGLVVPIRVQGTFAKPEYSADLRDVASRETLEEAIKDPEGTKEKVKALEETGKGLLQGLGFGRKK